MFDGLISGDLKYLTEWMDGVKFKSCIISTRCIIDFRVQLELKTAATEPDQKPIK